MNIYDSAGNIVTDAYDLAPLDRYGDISTANGFVSAFNSAMADADISGISIPYGTYNVNSPLQITRSNFVIDGGLCTINMRDDNGNPANCDCFRINDKSRITIKNFLINMRQSKDSSSGTAFYFLDAKFVTVENIDVFQIGCRGALIYNTDETSSTPGSTNIFFRGVKLRGINIQNTTQAEWPCGIIAVNLIDSGFRDCVVTGMARFSLEFKNYTKNSYMINNVIYGGDTGYTNESGIALGGDRPSTETVLGEGITAIGNVVKNCKYPLYLGRTAESVFNDNVFEGTVYTEGVTDSVFSGNVLTANNKSADALLRIVNGSNLFFADNIYNVDNKDLFYASGNSDIYVTGFFNGEKLDVLNPTSGTPS